MIRFLPALLLVSLWLAGCGQPQTAPPPPATPPWYLDPPANDSLHLYGAADGPTMKEAVNNALEDLLSRLSVSVASTFHSQTDVRTGEQATYRRVSTKSVTTRVEEIRLHDYQVLQSAQPRYDRFLVLVQIEKRALAQSLAKEVEDQLSLLERREEEGKAHHLLYHYFALKKGEEESRELLPRLLVLQAMGMGFDDRPYLERIDAFRSKREALRRSLAFHLETSGEGTLAAPAVRSALAKEAFTVIPHKPQTENQLVLRLELGRQTSRAYGFFIADLTLTLTVLTKEEEAISTQRLHLLGHSTLGEKAALEKGLEKIGSWVEENGVDLLLGLTPGGSPSR